MTNSKTVRISKVREAKHQLILEGALRVFSQKGYHEARLEDIAEVAGFSKASLYNYFKDKDEIFLHLLAQKHQEFLFGLTKDPHSSLQTSLSLRENLERYLRYTFTLMGNHFSFLLMSNDFMFNSLFSMSKAAELDQSEIATLIAELSKNTDLLFIQIIEEARAAGEIGTRLPADLLLLNFRALIMVTLMKWRRQGFMDPIEPTINNLITFFLHGVD